MALDKDNLFVGGEFNKAGGSSIGNIAKLDKQTGQINTNFDVSVIAQSQKYYSMVISYTLLAVSVMSMEGGNFIISLKLIV